MRALQTLIFCYLCSLCGSSSAAVLAKKSLWPQDKTLNVVFLDGTSAQKALVKTVAPKWVEGIRLHLVFFDYLTEAPNRTHIRVSFQSGTGSVLGDHGDYLAKTPTLMLDELNYYDLDNSMAQRYVLHEFGHALGFEHEFRNPDWPYGFESIKAHIDRCIPRLLELEYSRQQAQSRCEYLNLPLPKENTLTTAYDIHSIMNYPQTIILSDQSIIEIKASTKLSILDKLAMERWYGKSQ